MTIHVAHQSPASDRSRRELLRVVIVGHVDHGKSTLIGRLLHETGGLPDGKLETLKQISARRGMAFEWSFLLDALQTERDQGITIDTSQIRFRTSSRDIVLIDAPGHIEFLRNMITGAAQAHAAILIVDVAEGVREQTRRHGYLLHLLGVRQVAVLINKMDRVDFDQGRFRAIADEITAHLTGLGLVPSAVIPISARNGDGVARHTPAAAWFDGPTVLQALDAFSPARVASELPLRLPVQAVYKFDDRRIVAGRLESGRIAVGDEIVVMPGGKRARVKSIEAWPVRDPAQALRQAVAKSSIGVTLDDDIFVARGDLIVPAANPAEAARQLRARVFWLHQTPLAVGDRLVVRIGTAEARGEIAAVANVVDPGQLEVANGEAIGANYVGDVEITLAQPLATDPYDVNRYTGRIVLEVDGRIVGGGIVLAVNAADGGRVSPAASRPDVLAADDLLARASRLTRRFADMAPGQRLVTLRQEIAGKIVFTTSFGLEDQIIVHLLAEHDVDVDVVTLDTGRLFPETYALWAETERRYGRRVRVVYPQRADLEDLIAKQGINGFYESRPARLSCCHVRKVEPLNRALTGAQAWIAGLRADQSAHRADLALVEADAARGLIKLNPLFDRTRDTLLAFASKHNVPLNPLHARGFVSIGCAPCTRAIAPGEPERAGRWWWEDETKKECGLHLAR